MNWKIAAYCSRALYALLILGAALQGRMGAVLFNSIIFAVTFIVPFLARKNKEFHRFDVALMLLFIAPLSATFFGYTMESSVLGEDKLFHVAGGAVLAWFAAILYRGKIQGRLLFALAIVSFAVAVGALWEVYEWVLLVMKNDTMHMTLTDSMLDIIADTVGAVVAAVALVRRT